jgi:hypothetical protein
MKTEEMTLILGELRDGSINSISKIIIDFLKIG